MSDTVTRIGQHNTTTPPVFLILEHDALIAEDIIGSLKDMGPCETIHVSDAEALAQHLNTDIRVSAALLEMRYAQVVEHGFDRRLAEHGARVVLTIGEDDEQSVAARGWSMLIRPFTDEMIHAALADLAAQG